MARHHGTALNTEAAHLPPPRPAFWLTTCHEHADNGAIARQNSAIRDWVHGAAVVLGPLRDIGVEPYLPHAERGHRLGETGRGDKLEHARAAHVEHRDDLGRCHHQRLHNSERYRCLVYGLVLYRLVVYKYVVRRAAVTTEATVMTAATQIGSTPAYQVGDRVQVHREGVATPGRISSIHHGQDGIEYVVSLTAPDGGLGSVINVWTTSGHSSFLTPCAETGATR